MYEQFSVLNKLEKLLLKLRDRGAYRKYKAALVRYKSYVRREAKIKQFLQEDSFLNPNKIKQIADENGFVTVSHAGNAGDIIYALPTLRKMQEITGKPIHLYLCINKPNDINPLFSHPLGNVMLNEKMAAMLMPLLNSVPFIEKCAVHQDEAIHLKLDCFRDMGMYLDRGNIARWYLYTTGIIPDTATRWLSVRPNTQYADYVVIARSERYRNLHVDYSFLSKLDKVVFIGVASEYQDIQKYIPEIKWCPVNDFMEMAEIIAGCKFFIGNQSFPFSVAEALKVRRVLETSFEEPNVIPEGEHGYEFFLQDRFEWIVDHLDTSSIESRRYV